jgi:hypothetical protein
MKKNEALFSKWKFEINNYLRNNEESDETTLRSNLERFIEKSILGSWKREKPLIKTTFIFE